MYNHFRTLLLNLPYAGNAEEHIPTTFNGIILPEPLSSIYKLLFPDGTSRYYKRFLVQNYLQLIESAGISNVLTNIDPRITYDLTTSNYFKFYRNSNPVVKDIMHPIFISGKYSNNSSSDSHYDNFLISQVGNSTNVTVYSTVNKVYLTPTGKTNDPIAAELTLTIGDGNTTKCIPIGGTGVSFSLGGANTFTNSSDKTWEFIVESPYIFDFNATLQALLTNPTTKELFEFKPEVDVTKYKNLFDTHFNNVYRLAGYLVAYVIKCNSI